MRTRLRALAVPWTGAAAALAAAAAPLAAQETGHGPADAPGIFSVNLGVVVWTWVLFLLLLFVLRKTAWKPLLRVLEERERRIQEQLDEAARWRREAEALAEEGRRLLAEAHEKAQEIVAEGRRVAERLRDELVAEGRQQQQALLERAREEIERERARAVESLRREAVDLALAAAARLLRREVDSQENRRLVEDVLAELAAKGNGAAAARGARAARAAAEEGA